MTDSGWTIALEPAVLLPDRPVTVDLVYTPGRDHEFRGVTVVLRCVERYRFDRTQTALGSNGHMTSRRVTVNQTKELARFEAQVAGPGQAVRGTPLSWQTRFDVPGLGPASFEGEVLRCDWTLTAAVDIPMAGDARLEQAVHVAQPMALLRAGVVDTGAYGLFDEAPVNTDALPAQVKLAPVPVSLQEPFSGIFTVETGRPVRVQEVRLELRVKADVTVSGGHHEEIVVWRGILAAATDTFGGPLAAYPFTAPSSGAWTPSIDLPHGRARGVFHVILAESMAPDTHYVRDVALATTTDL